MAFNCNVAHTEPWKSRLVSADADPDFNDGMIYFNPVVSGQITGRHEQSNQSIAGRCQNASPHIRFRRVAVEGGKTFTYIYQADIAEVDSNFRTVGGRYQKIRGNIPLIVAPKVRLEVVDDDEWIGERPIT